MSMLLRARDWQQMYQQMALELAGSRDAEHMLVHSKRYGALADEIERLTKELADSNAEIIKQDAEIESLRGTR